MAKDLGNQLGLVKTNSIYGNQYTISTQGQVDAITGQQWDGIIKDYEFVIAQISKRVRWQGTMDFAVDVVTGASPRGLLPSMSWKYAYNDTGQWLHSATYEQATGIDLNGTEPDLGFFINLASDGSIKNYGHKVWIDPAPSSISFGKKPSGSHDMTSIITHEMLHAMGIAYDPRGVFGNKFRKLTVETNGRRYFSGLNAISVYGQNVPLASVGSADHIKLNNISKKQWTIMSEWGNYDISWRTPTALDFAILKDIGWNVV
jgi:hypothetical protein